MPTPEVGVDWLLRRLLVLTISNQQLESRGMLSRREALRVGALGLGGVTLADLLRHEATANTDARRPKSVIYVVLDGGPSHLDLWDLKPQAPTEYRGPFSPIATKLPGVPICEHMPLQAAMLDRAALVRGIRSVENDHFLSEVYTGLPRSSGKRPAFGSVVSKLAPTKHSLPTYVSLTMGQVIGETDSRAERSINGTISFQNVMATIYHTLGIDLDVKLSDFNGRPQYLLDDCVPIRELVS